MKTQPAKRGTRHVTPPKRNTRKPPSKLIEGLMTDVDRIRRENGITLQQMSDDLGLAVPAISQHLNMSRGFPDAEATLKYLQFAERQERGFSKEFLK